MIKIIKPYFSHKDERGLIVGLVQEGNWKEINIVTSKKGTRRGDHYHKLTNELFIILSGRITLHLQMQIDRDRTMTYELFKGDVFTVEPGIWHTFEVLEDSSWINALDRIVPDDMYKVD